MPKRRLASSRLKGEVLVFSRDAAVKVLFVAVNQRGSRPRGGPRARVNARRRSKRGKLQHAQAASLRSPTSPGASSSRSTSRTGWFAFFPSEPFS